MLRLSIIISALLLLSYVHVQPATITIDGSVTNQVIDGFGVNANYWHFNSNELWPPLDALIDEGGMTLFRVVINNGWEAVNDNDDPDVMNWDYYNAIYNSPEFEKAWDLIGHLNQKGITNGIILNFQGPGPDWLGGDSLDDGMEAEWAEMVGSFLVYARNVRNLHFYLIGPNNEPDISGEGITISSPQQYTLALHKLAQFLDTNGLSDIRFVAPDLSSLDLDYLSEMTADPLVMSKLAHFGLHSYSAGGPGSAILDFIQNSAYPDRNFWMTEFNVWCSECEAGISGNDDWDYSLGTADYLFGHLANGASAGLVWEGYDSYYPHHLNWSFWGLMAVDNRNAFPKTYTPRKNFYTLAQVAKFVRPGARRIDVNGPTGPLELLAFYHDALGQFTLIGINTDTQPANFSANLTSLPAIASLDLYYTTSDTNLAHAAVVPISGGAFTVTVPDDCIFTLSGFDPARLAVSVQITNPADGTSLPSPTNLLIQAIASNTTGTLGAVSFYTNGTKIGEISSAPYDFTWSNAAPGTYTLCASATNSLANIGISPSIKIVVVGPAAQIVVMPSDVLVSPQGSQQFTGTVLDAFGHALVPQPPASWSVNGGGAINSNGLFLAGTNLGGPFSVVAGDGPVTGQASLLVTTNLATAGQPYTWYSMMDFSLNGPRISAPGLSDGDFNTDVHLLPGTAEDTANVFEAAGVVWSNAQTISRVVFRNGSMNNYFDGVFASDFRLQFSSNGIAWADAGPEWHLTPPYVYNSPDVVGMDFTFCGSIATTRGVRCLGRVHTSEPPFPPNSWVAFAREIQVFAGVADTNPLLSAKLNTNGTIGLSWPASFQGFLLECSTNAPPLFWATVTNLPTQSNSVQQVTLSTSGQQRFFRLHKP